MGQENKKPPDLNIHIIEKVRITDGVNLEFHQVMWSLHPGFFWILLTGAFGIEFVGIFIVEGIVGKIIIFVMGIVLFLWGDVLLAKVKKRKK
jgi:hypothetical protein